ncbi:MAG: gamma-glutamyltransferase family protein [Alphaproteobacteria bacterium]
MTAPSRPHFTTRPEIQGTFGAVSTTHWIASAVGMSILEKGGNAFDAAVAAGLTLQVVEPHLNGPGGEVPMIVSDVRGDRPEVICGQGVAPAAATIEHYRSLGLDLVPGTGLLAACVPGAFDAWMLLLRRHGTMTLNEVMSPVIGYAANGMPVVPRVSSSIDSVSAHFAEHWPTSAAVFLPKGAAPASGSLFANPKLAETYASILREAEAAGGDREKQIERARHIWYRGFVAEAIDRFFRSEPLMDVSGEPHYGLLTGDDMAAWQATIEEPLTYDYGRYTVCKPGPWSQGPVMLQQLALLSGFDLASLDPTGPDFVHLQIEAAKLAFADREAHYGDPEFVDVPMEHLLSQGYNDERRSLMNDTASLEMRPGSPGGGPVSASIHMSDKRDRGSAAGAGEPTVARDYSAGALLPAERGDTVHLDIIDRHGNMIAATPSGGWLQSSPVVPELGFPLGTRAQMFWLDAGLPGSLEPRKRPRTTLSTSLALRDGEPYLVWGTPGGDQQDQWSTQVFLRHVESNLNLQESIDWPAWHIEHFPSSFWPREGRTGVVVVESRFPDATIAELRRRGHIVEVGDAWSEGRVGAVSRDGGMLKAGSDPRSMQHYAIGR